MSESDNEVTVKMCITLKKIYSSTNFERAKTVQLISIFLIIRNVPSAVNQHIRIIRISGGSCDPENASLITAIQYILTYIHIENNYFKL